MSFVELLAKMDSIIRPRLVKFSPLFYINVYSNGRKQFLSKLIHDVPSKAIQIPEESSRVLWGIKFASPLFNAAGMFKNGDGYELCAAQGAGAFLAGTTTAEPRIGNNKKGVDHPFTALPRSHASINWMGLPNYGHETVAKKLSQIIKVEGCPVGISLSADPGKNTNVGLINGLELYDAARVDFIEINESCPNVEHEESACSVEGIPTDLIDRLELIREKFLLKRKRNLPVIVKFSVDTSMEQIPALIKLLLDIGFDGINIGNTSTNYARRVESITEEEKMNYNFFTETFGGGVSGLPIQKDSLDKAAYAVEVTRKLKPAQEFHVIRTGGIIDKNDIEKSKKAGINMNQWFSGYFDAFAAHGHKLYKEMFTV